MDRLKDYAYAVKTWVKANPTKANYGSVGAGTSTHLESELFNSVVDELPRPVVKASLTGTGLSVYGSRGVPCRVI